MGTGRLCSVSALHALPTLSQNHGDPWPASGECDDSQGTVVTVSQAAHHNHSGVVSHNLLRNDYFNYLISADTSGKVFIWMNNLSTSWTWACLLLHYMASYFKVSTTPLRLEYLSFNWRFSDNDSTVLRPGSPLQIPPIPPPHFLPWVFIQSLQTTGLFHFLGHGVIFFWEPPQKCIMQR